MRLTIMPDPLSTIQITMNDPTRALLQSWLRRPTKPSGLVRRARALLLLAQGYRYAPTARQVGLSERHVRKWARRFREQGAAGLHEQPRSGRPPVFAPQVALYVVKLACERPDQFGRSLSQWNCSELARQLQADGIVPSISFETVRRILQSHKLKPWRSHLWLSPKVPRDQHFAQQVKFLVELYTRPLAR
jgi:transposase